MSEVIILTNTDKKKVKEVALDLEEVYRTGIRYTISEFISAFGGGINRTSGKDDDFVIPGPKIKITVLDRVHSYFGSTRILSTIVYILYKEEDKENVLI